VLVGSQAKKKISKSSQQVSFWNILIYQKVMVGIQLAVNSKNLLDMHISIVMSWRM
jgi:uncharacterized membrane protein YqgA involved in biofilm formation